MIKAVEELAEKLGHGFNRIELLELALTHCSVSGEHNNERLEFLGDSILSLVISEVLYEKFQNAREGQLSRLRSRLVSGESLSDLARDLGVGNYLRLGSGELKTGGRRRDSILADAMEAIIGATYLDAGMKAARDCILGWFAGRLKNLSVQLPKDAKTQLQEYLQARKYELPVYEVLTVSGDPHHQVFEVMCRIEALDIKVKGEGKNRRRAEQAAALQVLEQLEQMAGKLFS